MAKAKKQQKSAEPAAKQTAPKSSGTTKTPKPATPVIPPIDTGLAASAAARLVAHKDELSDPNAPARKESTSFKQLKESLHKPVGTTGPNILQNIAQSKKFNSSVPGRQQVGRNQTFGADVNRTGVPRRTGG